MVIAVCNRPQLRRGCPAGLVPARYRLPADASTSASLQTSHTSAGTSSSTIAGPTLQSPGRGPHRGPAYSVESCTLDMPLSLPGS